MLVEMKEAPDSGLFIFCAIGHTIGKDGKYFSHPFCYAVPVNSRYCMMQPGI